MSKTKASSSPTVKKPLAAKSQPSRDEIALRAYHIYVKRGCTLGNEVEDWVRAEKELLELSKEPGRKTKVVSIAAA